jgi:hypothetical protein
VRDAINPVISGHATPPDTTESTGRHAFATSAALEFAKLRSAHEEDHADVKAGDRPRYIAMNGMPRRRVRVNRFDSFKKNRLDDDPPLA